LAGRVHLGRAAGAFLAWCRPAALRP
jgi:hypothetical protein